MCKGERAGASKPGAASRLRGLVNRYQTGAHIVDSMVNDDTCQPAPNALNG